MAVTYTAPFIQNLKLAVSTITAVQADKTGATTANLVKLLDAGANGSKIVEIGFKAWGNTSAAQVTIFKYDGANYFFIDELEVTAIVSSVTVKSNKNLATYIDLGLVTGESIYMGITVFNTNINVYAKYGDY